MIVSRGAVVAQVMSGEQVVAEALARIRAARDAAGPELAAELDDLIEDLDPAAGYSDLQGQDWAMPYLLAAVMGVTVREP